MDGNRFSDLTRQRAFMRFWVARLFGTTGNQMLMVAIGWQMYDLTGSAWDLGLVGLYQFVPALGGLLFVAGAAAVYGACALSFVVACVLVFLLRYPRGPRLTEPTSMRSILAGLAFVWQRKVLLGAVSLDLFAVLLGGATALLPMFAKDILFVGPWGLGLLRGAPAIGALVMSAVLTRWPLRRRVGRTLLWSVAGFGLCMVVFGLSTSFWLSMLVLALSGGLDTVSVVVRQTLVQLDTPDGMRGRVSAVNSVFIGASNQLGEFESGATAALLGPVGSVVLGGLGTLLVAALWRRIFPTLAHRDRLDRDGLYK